MASSNIVIPEAAFTKDKRSRSSRPELFCKKDLLRNFAKFIGKHLCKSLVFNKIADLRSAGLQPGLQFY